MSKFSSNQDMKELCLKYGIVVRPKSEPTRQMVLGTENQKKRGPKSNFGSSFYVVFFFFSPPPGPALYNLG